MSLIYVYVTWLILSSFYIYSKSSGKNLHDRLMIFVYSSLIPILLAAIFFLFVEGSGEGIGFFLILILIPLLIINLFISFVTCFASYHSIKSTSYNHFIIASIIASIITLLFILIIKSLIFSILSIYYLWITVSPFIFLKLSEKSLRERFRIFSYITTINILFIVLWFIFETINQKFRGIVFNTILPSISISSVFSLIFCLKSNKLNDNFDKQLTLKNTVIYILLFLFVRN